MARSRKRELVSQREYARRRGISHSSVQRAVKSGRISTVDGKIDPALADREWSENTDHSKPRGRIAGRPRHKRPEGMPSGLTDFGEVGVGPEGRGSATRYARARAAREVCQAQLAKLQLDRQRGTLVRADEVRIAAFNAARGARDQLIALPERLSAILAGIQDADEVRRILEEEIERVCTVISEGSKLL